MPTVEWLLLATSNKVVIGFAAGLIVFTMYFAVDVMFFLTGHDFRRMNVYMFHFTRNNPSQENADKRLKEQGSGGDALEKMLLLSAVSLRQLYGNRFVFWRLFMATRRVTPEQRLLKFGSHTNQILRPICYRCAINPGAVKKRGAFFKTVRQRYIAAIVFDRTPGRSAYTYSVFLFRLEDIKRFNEYSEAPPSKGQFHLYENFVLEYQRDPTNGFGVAKITAG